MTRLRGRFPSGERVVDSTPRNYRQNVSVLGALTFDGILAVMTIAGSVDTAVFRTYVTQVLVSQLWRKVIVLCDNLQVHKAAGIREVIEAVGAKLVFLPPYSPDSLPLSCVGRNSNTCYVQPKPELMLTSIEQSRLL